MTLDGDQKGSKTKHAGHVWFQKLLFARLEDDHDMDTEVELSMRKSKSADDNSEMMVEPSEDKVSCVKV